MDVREGKQYRFKDGTRARCQVLRIDPGNIPVFRGAADLVIGILDGPNMGMEIPFGMMARFKECVVPA